MRDIAAEEIAAIQSPTVVARNMLWVTAKNRSTQADESMGFWNDVMFVTASVKDGRTGAIVNRDFLGVGMALTIGSIPLTSDITIRSVDIDIPYLDSTVAQLVRGYDVRGAPMQLYRGYFDPATRIMVAPAKARFIGYVDGSPIVTPKEGGEGSITLHCVSTTRELTRTSSEVRSRESQLLRSAGDLFYADTGVVGEWTLFWGVANTPIAGAGSSTGGAATTPATGSGGTIA
jgi:hypothetical protein